ncbi:hypothetical protein GCM10027591_01360 [Zhihengliuella somnathii]
MTEITGRRGSLAADIPEPWIAENVRDEIELIAYLPANEKVPFTPNLVVTVNPFEGTIEEFAGRAVTALLATTQQPQLIDVGLWGGRDTRTVVYTHSSPQLGLRLRSVEFLTIIDGVAIQATATTTVPQWLAIGPQLEEIARTLRVVGPVAEHADAQEQPNRFTRPDSVYSEYAGVPVADYSTIAAEQLFPVEGELITSEAMQLLQEMGEGLKIGRLNAGKYAAPLKSLAAAGLAEGVSLTDLGRTCAGLLGNADLSLRMSAVQSGVQRRLFVWSDGQIALAVAERAPAGAPAEFEDGLQHIILLPLGEISTHIARWLGTHPAWSLELEPPVVGEELLNAQVFGEGAAPPAGANAAWQDALSQEWIMWTFEGVCQDGEIEPLHYLKMGRRGHYRLAGVGDDHYALVPQASVTVQDQIEDRLQALLFRRPVQLV